MPSKKKIIGVAAGVAAAATVAAVAVVRNLSVPRRNYLVRPIEDGWAVETDGATRATSTHGTKKEALSAARALARETAPSRLVIQRLDGTVQDEHSYEREG